MTENENETKTTETPAVLKTAVVGVVGRTNAGKSTLVNRLVGEKVSIVSPVEQTTRNTIRGIVCDPRGQLVLLDTPGLHKAVGHLGTILNRMARRSSAGVDVLCVVFDASSEPKLEDEGWMQRVAKERPEKVVFVLNKSDRRPFYESQFRELWKGDFDVTWVTASAVSDEGARPVLDALFSFAEEGELLFPEDVVTDYPRRMTIADSIREKYLARMHQEVPHEMGILVKEINESAGRWDVKVDVLVNRQSQKPIVIGRGAATLKYVRKCAERELAEMFGVKVAIEMWVRVEPNWMKNDRLLVEMGYLGGEI
jgi:GTP-binding protein Era